VVGVRLTDAEIATLEAHAETTGIPVSVWLRGLALAAARDNRHPGIKPRRPHLKRCGDLGGVHGGVSQPVSTTAPLLRSGDSARRSPGLDGGPRHDEGMAKAAHSSDVLAAWQDGETRLLYAGHRSDAQAPLYYLEQGTAAAVRPWAKQHLACPVPGCPSPDLTTVNRGERRDGFKHATRGAGGHEPESMWHLQGKALMARWARSRYPDVTVVEEQATASRDRRADVMLTWPDGRRIAVEIQYAPLTPDAWRVRHESYRQQGIVDLWLLGHGKRQLKPSRALSYENASEVSGRVDLSPLQLAIAEAGVPVLWIHPLLEEIGTAFESSWAESWEYTPRDEWDGRDWPVPVRDGRYGRSLFVADPLDRCSLSPDGLMTPTYRRAQDGAAEIARIEALRLAAHEERKSAAEQKARDREAYLAKQHAAEQARKQAAEEDRLAHQLWWRGQQDQWQREWLASDLHARVIARYEKVPACIADHVGPAEGVHAYPDRWHAVVYGGLLLAKRRGERVRVKAVYDMLTAVGIPIAPDRPDLVHRTITAWLTHLCNRGHVRLIKPRNRGIDWIEVIGGVEVVEQVSAEEAAALAILEAERAAQEKALQEKRRAEEAVLREQRKAAEARWAGQRAINERLRMEAAMASDLPRELLRAAKQGRELQCRRCRQPLDPRLAAAGVHMLPCW
jgi:hypothetical protein